MLTYTEDLSKKYPLWHKDLIKPLVRQTKQSPLQLYSQLHKTKNDLKKLHFFQNRIKCPLEYFGLNVIGYEEFFQLCQKCTFVEEYVPTHYTECRNLKSILNLNSTQNTIFHADKKLYPLLLSMKHSENATQSKSFIMTLYHAWCDPYHEQVKFLPQIMQNQFLDSNDFIDTVKETYPDEFVEKKKFLGFYEDYHEVWSQRPLNQWLDFFSVIYKQIKLDTNLKHLDEKIHKIEKHLVCLSRLQPIPKYNGETSVYIYSKNPASSIFVQNSLSEKKEEDAELFMKIKDKLPSILPIKSIVSLFNDLEYFYERYVLQIKRNYVPFHNTLTTQVIRNMLLHNETPKARTKFEQLQLDTLKKSWMLWIQNKRIEACLDVSFKCCDTHFKGNIDVIWNNSLYLLTASTPPTRKEILEGINPVLPILAMACEKKIDQIGYIHLKPYGSEVINIVQYKDSEDLIITNKERVLKKLTKF